MSSVVPLRPTVRTFYGATDLLADNRSGPNCAMVNTYEKQEK